MPETVFALETPGGKVISCHATRASAEEHLRRCLAMPLIVHQLQADGWVIQERPLYNLKSAEVSRA